MPQRGITRSRTGCLVCRKRHVRCDEQRPSCQNCFATQRACIYPPIVVPLRDRRMLQKNAVPVGQQAPWALTSTTASHTIGSKLTASWAMDPFDTLPIKMPFKSQELYHYFYQCGSAFAVAPSDPKDDCMALATLDEHALRSTILIAGIHYSWNAGNLKAYDSAFLFHKVESIRLVNKWLQSPNSDMFVACMRQILTICLAEACLGNIPAAETHLNGVMAILNSRERNKDTWVSPNYIELELTDRYLLLTSCFVLFLKSRLQDFRSLRAAQGIDASDDSSSIEALKLMRLWHGVEKGGLDTRLKAMRMFPSFFSAPPHNRRPRDINVLPIVDCIKDVTQAVDRFRVSPTAVNCNQIWNEGGATRLMLALVDSHVWSFANDDDRSDSSSEKQSLHSFPRYPWIGIAAAMELYMHSVLKIVNAGEPMECRLLYRVLLMVKQDIEQTREDLDRNKSHPQSLWLWKVFTGAIALARSKDDHFRQANACSCEADLDVLYEWFCGCIRAWTAVTGKNNWKNIISVLGTIAWPEFMSHPEKGYAAALLG